MDHTIRTLQTTIYNLVLQEEFYGETIRIRMRGLED